MFKEYKELSNGDLYQLGLFIDNLYDLNIYEENDYLWIKNRVRHIMEILIKDKETEDE